MNLQWKDIDDEIKIGLIQHLLLKVFKKKGMSNKISTQNIDLYNNFIRNIDILAVKDKFDPILEQSFNRINEQYFDNLMDKPNLVWGTNSFRKLACYNFHSDTVTMSTIFTDARNEVIDQIMYHELLHKHLKFAHKNGRSSHHSPEFRRRERSFPNFHEIEKEIGQIIRTKKRSNNLLKKTKIVKKKWYDFF